VTGARHFLSHDDRRRKKAKRVLKSLAGCIAGKALLPAARTQKNKSCARSRVTKRNSSGGGGGGDDDITQSSFCAGVRVIPFSLSLSNDHLSDLYQL